MLPPAALLEVDEVADLITVVSDLLDRLRWPSSITLELVRHPCDPRLVGYHDLLLFWRASCSACARVARCTGSDGGCGLALRLTSQVLAFSAFPGLDEPDLADGVLGF